MKLYLMKRRYIELTENERKILLWLALHGRGTKYTLASELDLPYSSVSGSVRRLEKMGYVKPAGGEKFRPTGLMKQFYKLTLSGVQRVLRGELGPGDRERIARASKELLPLTYGKIDFLESIGLKEKVPELIRYSDFELALADLAKMPPIFKLELTEEETDALLWYYGLLRSEPKSGRPGLLRKLAKDPEIREFLLKVFSAWKESLSEDWELVTSSLRILSKKAPSVGRR